jgi:acyl dehydratase
MARTLLTHGAEAMIGTEVSYISPEPLGRASIRYFAMAVGDLNPVYLDETAARRAGFDDVIAPPTLVCETNQFAGVRPWDESGYIGHVWDLGLEGCRLIRGENRYRFEQPVHPTDVVTATWKLAELTEKTSGSGLAMLVVRSVCTYTNQNGSLLATNEDVVIHVEISA